MVSAEFRQDWTTKK